MAYYRTDRMVKMTRKALGISQEKLSEGICDVSTLSRMENGHFKIKRSTYRKLMEKMGREVEKGYVICIGKDGTFLDKRTEWERAYKEQDYNRAEEILHDMQENSDDNVLTRQYIARAAALVEYRLRRISAEEMIQRVDTALRMTVPDYEKYLQKPRDVFPFVEEELMALVSLGNGYRVVGKNERGLQMYEAVLRCLQAGYIMRLDGQELQIVVRSNIANMYAEQGRHIEALAEINTCLDICKESDYGYWIIKFLVSQAHNNVRLVKKEIGESEKLLKAGILLQQAYGLAVARESEYLKVKIREYYERYFKNVEC